MTFLVVKADTVGSGLGTIWKTNRPTGTFRHRFGLSVKPKGMVLRGMNL
jgi:hypothetical protein